MTHTYKDVVVVNYLYQFSGRGISNYIHNMYAKKYIEYKIYFNKTLFSNTETKKNSKNTIYKKIIEKFITKIMNMNCQ